MIDKLITIGKALQIPVTALRYMVVVALTVLGSVYSTRIYMQASESVATMQKVALAQEEILKELKLLRLQNDSLKDEQFAIRSQRHTDMKSITLVMARSFDDVIKLLRDAANGNQVLLNDIADKEAHIKELLKDNFKLEAQLRKKRPPPEYKGRIVSEEID